MGLAVGQRADHVLGSRLIAHVVPAPLGADGLVYLCDGILEAFELVLVVRAVECIEETLNIPFEGSVDIPEKGPPVAPMRSVPA